MKRSCFVFLLLVISDIASAQVTAQENEWRGRPLPPSLQAEIRQLRAKQGSRTIVYRDTVRGSQLARTAFMDSTFEFDSTVTFADSALSVIDSGVSLTHKEWLDSMIVELPELARFGDQVHFNYSPQILTEPQRKQVEITPLAIAGINPIVKENLPYFDQSPIPIPLTQGRRGEGFLLGGAGNEYLPRIEGGLSYTFTDRLSLNADGVFSRNAGVGAIKDHLAVNAKLNGELGIESALEEFRAVALTALVNVSGKSFETAIDAQGDSLSMHRLSSFAFGFDLDGKITQSVGLLIGGTYSAFSDDLIRTVRENNERLYAHLTKDFGNDFRFRGEVDLGFADREELLVNSAVTPTNSLGMRTYRALLGQRSWGWIEWFGGLRYISASDGTGNKRRILPQGMIRIPLNPRWEIGGSFEPNSYLNSHRELAQFNPFYSPNLAVQLDSTIDPRRIAIDKLNVAGFMNYMLSPDDQIRTEVRYIDRDDEPIFFARELASGRTEFIARPGDTRRLIVTGAGNFLMFKRDILTAGVEFRSATIVGEDVAVPFEPVLKLTGSYSFNSIAPYLRPEVEFNYLSRADHSMAVVNLGATFIFGRRVSVLLRAENILNSPNDYWTGYNEFPRSIWGGFRYEF